MHACTVDNKRPKLIHSPIVLEQVFSSFKATRSTRSEADAAKSESCRCERRKVFINVLDGIARADVGADQAVLDKSDSASAFSPQSVLGGYRARAV